MNRPDLDGPGLGSTDQAGPTAERTAAVGPADPPPLPSGSPRQLSPAEFSARRRGPFRRYFHDHPLVMDFVIVAIYLLGSATTLVGQLAHGHFLHLTLTLVSAGLLMTRRYRPVAMIAVLAVIETVLLLAEPYSSNAGLSLWFGLYAVAVKRSSTFSFVTAALVSAPLAAVLLLFFRLPAPMRTDGTDAALISLVATALLILSNTIATGIGISVRRDRNHEMELRAWAERNEVLASVSERNRIAREMHDVVAHSLTVMIALSDGAAVVVKRNPARAAEVLAQLSQTGRAALADMRRVLGVLREDGSLHPVAHAPLPAHSGLEALLEGFRAAGLPLSLTTMGPELPEDPAFQLTVYRILQESLTNVLRYGRGVSQVQIRVIHQDPVVRLRVSDDGVGSMVAPPSVGTGQGIVGMKERARIYAGTVTAGPGKHAGWVVEAVLVCPESSASALPGPADRNTFS